ncbi:MAG: hypothetical protein QXO42_03670 [Ignisphaera sp.]
MLYVALCLLADIATVLSSMDAYFLASSSIYDVPLFLFIVSTKPPPVMRRALAGLTITSLGNSVILLATFTDMLPVVSFIVFSV